MKVILMASILFGSFAAHAAIGGAYVSRVKKTHDGVKVELAYAKAIPVINKLGLLGPSTWLKTVDCVQKDNELVAILNYSRKAVFEGKNYIQHQYKSYRWFRINVNELCAEGVPTIVELNGKRIIE